MRGKPGERPRRGVGGGVRSEVGGGAPGHGHRRGLQRAAACSARRGGDVRGGHGTGPGAHHRFQVPKLRFRQEIHEAFTEMGVERADSGAIVGYASQTARRPIPLTTVARAVVPLEPGSRDPSRVLEEWQAADPLHRCTGRPEFLDGRPSWVTYPLRASGEVWGAGWVLGAAYQCRAKDQHLGWSAGMRRWLQMMVNINGSACRRPEAGRTWPARCWGKRCGGSVVNTRWPMGTRVDCSGGLLAELSDYRSSTIDTVLSPDRLRRPYYHQQGSWVPPQGRGRGGGPGLAQPGVAVDSGPSVGSQ